MGYSDLTEIEAVYPCSPSQQEVLQISADDPASEYYHVQQILELTPPTDSTMLDARHLETAWRQVVSRHPSLRTAFIRGHSSSAKFHQILLAQSQANVVHIECKEENLMATLAYQQPFQFDYRQPLHRLTICRTSRGRLVCKFDSKSTGLNAPL
ncbi:CoA-dependent acyltransferase [Thozetella sp. PMI_491]|nr:CoA-dependent acyltransferase [Thozetella sp. PMI_491]